MDIILRILLIIFLSFYLVSFGYTQKEKADSIGCVKFSDCKIKSKKEKEIRIFDTSTVATVIKLKSASICQTACYYGVPDAQQPISKVTNSFTIYYIYDSLNVFCDTIISKIQNYLNSLEEFDKEYNKNSGNFCSLPINEGFYNVNGNVIPFISNGYFGKGAEFYILFGKHLYKLVCTKSEGLGALVSFIRQNMEISYFNMKVDLLSTACMLSDMKKYVNNFICDK